eukprot:tig00020961_g16697.t1
MRAGRVSQFPLSCTRRRRASRAFGEEIVVETREGGLLKPGDADVRTMDLRFDPAGKWVGEARIGADDLARGIQYRYALKLQVGHRAEEGGWRLIQLSRAQADTVQTVEMKDFWRSSAASSNNFLTSAFKEVIFRPEEKDLQEAAAKGQPPAVVVSANPTLWIRLSIEVPRIEPGHVVPALTGRGSTAWRVDLLLDPASMPFEYKYLIRDRDSRRALHVPEATTPILPLLRGAAPAGKPGRAAPAPASPPKPAAAAKAGGKGGEAAAARAGRAGKEGKEAGAADEAAAAAEDEAEEAKAAAPAARARTDTPAPERGGFEGVQPGARLEGAAGAPHLIYCTDSPFRYGEEWRGAGAAVPVFALRTAASMGAAIDWAADCGLQMLQLLPVNDTTVTMSWRDSYPYSSVSVFALHPMYVHIESIPGLPQELLEAAREARERLEPNEELDYEEVLRTKLGLLRRAFRALRDPFLASPDFTHFFEGQRRWLLPYAVFGVLRDLTGTSEFAKWGPRADPDPAWLESVAAPESVHYDAVAFAYFVQFHAYNQLLAASQHAAARRVALKGDLPIGVNKYCVDTWVTRKDFNMHAQTGAPPDFFANKGQNWGFPTYNWAAMKEDGYAWWRARLAFMGQFFHAYRIDHILGFFRIWEIPEHCVTGLLGRFSPALPIDKSELDKRGIWDVNRLTDAHVHWPMLSGLFGARAGWVASTFFHQDGGRLRFKAEFDSERKVEALMAGWKPKDDAERASNADLKGKLFDLLANVVLLRDPGEPWQKFHFRIEAYKTASFHELPGAWKAELGKLYHNYFFERQEETWRRSALERLPMMKAASEMFVCGEDLGMIPACVPPTLDELSILGLRIQRMTTDPKQEFGVPARYPYMTVCTPSCHDMSTIRAWWEEDYGTTQRFWNHVLGRPGEAPKFLDPGTAEAFLEQHLAAPSLLAVFPVQDILAASPELKRPDPRAEQINVPSNPEHYWKYRMHVRLEELGAGSGPGRALRDKLRGLIERAGRGRTYATEPL